ncbi:MAG: hypothetical protein HY905_19155 [Deltaproteobacteria bacterium]|nr:hypothetical protein [Deltaproteobacteria bacterium]
MRWAGVLVVLLLAPAASAAATEPVLQQPAPEDVFHVGVSLGLGYSSVDVPEDGTADLLPLQVGVDFLLFTHWEAMLDLRVDLDPKSPGSPVNSYAALLWLIAHFDLLPLSPFVGLGGGAVLDVVEPMALAGTFGATVGLSLWFEASWRLTLRGAQRWYFGLESTMPFDLLLTAEYFF